MVAVQEMLENGLVCGECGQGFCEVLDNQNTDIKGMMDAGMTEQVHEPTIEANESLINRLKSSV